MVWQDHLMRSTGCGLRGRPLYWQSSTAQAWWVISAGSSSLRGVSGCPLPGRGAGGAALLSEDADVGLLLTGDGTVPAPKAADLDIAIVRHSKGPTHPVSWLGVQQLRVLRDGRSH